MSAPAQSLRWFARHEARLIWRDLIGLVTGGKPARAVAAGVVTLLVVLAFHAGAVWMLRPVVEGGVTLDRATLVPLAGATALLFSLMLSQGLESVTRAYYARSDLDLILTAPARSERLFAVRSLVLGVQTMGLSVLIVAPVIHAMAWLDGPRWLAGYGVVAALAAFATALAIALTLFLFRTLGAARTRLAAQIVAAIVGAGFVIAVQFVAIALGSGLSRLSTFTNHAVIQAAPDPASGVWLPVWAVAGDPISLAVVACVGFGSFAAMVILSARRFGRDAIHASGRVDVDTKGQAFAGFRPRSVRAALRAKEWSLLARDPWLASQALQQILYLLPPAAFLYVSMGEDGSAVVVVTAVVVMAAGQLAGGLAWITISGEDAHDLVVTAPVPPRTVLRAKIEAVAAVVAGIVAPFVLGVALLDVRAALALATGALLATASSVAIQLWFRRQMNRSLFRRRQVSSKVATMGEAFVSILWAGFACAGILEPVAAPFAAILALLILAAVRYARPPRDAAGAIAI